MLKHAVTAAGLWLLVLGADANPLAQPQLEPVTPPLMHSQSDHSFGYLLDFYVRKVGLFEGHQARSYPVPSLYARQALAAHELPWSVWLIVDRLLRSWREAARPMATVQTMGQARYVDPLTRNNWWLDAR